MNRVFASLLRGFHSLSAARRRLLIVFGLCIGLLLLGHVSERHAPLGSRGSPRTNLAQPQLGQDAELNAEWRDLKESVRVMSPAPAGLAGSTVSPLGDGPAYGSPLIVHAAELSVTTRDFSHSRATLQDILEQHHGYASRLRMTGQPSGSTLTATLRVPSSEFVSTVADLKALGNVEKEEQTADEITQQHADLEARLANAQNTLQRLQTILANTKPWDHPGELQRQFANVKAEIARLEAERIAAEHRTVFANVLFSLREEVMPPVESFGAQFRRAARAGITDAFASLSSIILFVLSYGPAFLVWAVLLLLPSRWIWKKWHATLSTGVAGTAQSS